MSGIKLKFKGGPAFPTQPVPEGAMTGFTGMMLRDWFASMAIQSLVQEALTRDRESWDETAQHAYFIADAMLREREK